MLLRGMPIHPGTCALQSDVYQASKLTGYQFAIKLRNDGSKIFDVSSAGTVNDCPMGTDGAALEAAYVYRLEGGHIYSETVGSNTSDLHNPRIIFTTTPALR